MEDLFRSALGQEDGVALRILYKYGHHAPRKVERDLVEFPVLLNQGLLVEIGAIQDRCIEQVLQTGLKMADEVPIPEHFIRFLAGDIAMPLQDNPIFGERAGLIGAEHVHSAEVLNSVETLYDHFLAAHGERALGEADGDNHGQHLRGQANSDGHREEECSPPIVLGKSIDEEDQGHHDRHELNHEPCETAQALVKACWRSFLRDGTRHGAEIGINSRNDDDRGRCAALNAGTHEAYVLEFDRRTCGVWVGIVKLLDRERLSGQRTLAHEQILRGQNPHIAWDHVSSR